jgi:hypothetical protein
MIVLLKSNHEIQVFMAENEFRNPEVNPYRSFLYWGGANIAYPETKPPAIIIFLNINNI